MENEESDEEKDGEGEIAVEAGAPGSIIEFKTPGDW